MEVPDWTDQGSVRGISAWGAVVEGEGVVVGLEGGSKVPLASVRGSAADMAGLWSSDVVVRESCRVMLVKTR